MEQNIENCPWCDGDIHIDLGFSTLAELIVCPHCGKKSQVEGDYSDADSWYFCLSRVPE